MKIFLKENQEEIIEGLHMDYPYVLHETDLRNTKVPWHWHEEVEFDYVVQGEMEVSTINRNYVFQGGEAFFMNSNILSQMNARNPKTPCLMESHLFHPVFLSGHFKSLFETKYISPVLQNRKIDLVRIDGETDGQKAILKKLRQAAGIQKQPKTEFQTRNLFSEIWLLLLHELENRKVEENNVKPLNQERIQNMLLFIHENYDSRITLDEIASSALISKRECLRCFQDCIHRTPFEYLQDYRLEMAEKLLKNTDLPITEIAMQTGFGNAAYFGKVFKSAIHKTPGNFRKEYRQR